MSARAAGDLLGAGAEAVAEALGSVEFVGFRERERETIK